MLGLIKKKYKKIKKKKNLKKNNFNKTKLKKIKGKYSIYKWAGINAWVDVYL